MHFGTVPRYFHFNPLPRKEGDEALSNAIAQLSHFNPLPRKEGDSFQIKKFACQIFISIHSLVKRETVKITVSTSI